MVALTVFALFYLQLQSSFALDNGLAVTPPLGWRSWNCFHGDINQSRITNIINEILTPRRKAQGKLTSLYQLGYQEVGVDDNWQTCDSTGHNFHDKNGNPVLNTVRFPDLAGMVAYAHSKRVRVGWYFNNCICSEHGTPHRANDVDFLRKYDFDGVKLDGCGSSHNITEWAQLINISDQNHPMLMEDCHNQPNYATLDWCDMNFFRTSGDINPSWGSIVGNLQTTRAYQDPVKPIARPGCWPYPDMLEVGNMATVMEERSHFGAWCVVSAPLILGYDLTDQTKAERVWPIISNLEAIGVNQAWAGHPGLLIAQASSTSTLPVVVEGVSDSTPSGKGEEEKKKVQDFPNWQIWGKKMPSNKFAVFFLNIASSTPLNLTLKFSQLNVTATNMAVRDIWEMKDLGNFTNEFTTTNLAMTDSRFVMLTPM